MATTRPSRRGPARYRRRPMAGPLAPAPCGRCGRTYCNGWACQTGH